MAAVDASEIRTDGSSVDDRHMEGRVPWESGQYAVEIPG